MDGSTNHKHHSQFALENDSVHDIVLSPPPPPPPPPPTGQFWNIPIDVVRYNETIDGTVRSDTYTITVNYPGQLRQFVGFLYPLTWEFDERQCLYVGMGREVQLMKLITPNDPVLQGEYTDYIIDDLYGTDFAFGHFVSSACSTSTPTITPVLTYPDYFHTTSN